MAELLQRQAQGHADTTGSSSRQCPTWSHLCTRKSPTARYLTHSIASRKTSIRNPRGVAVERLIFFFRDEKMNAQSGGRAPVWLLIAISSLGSGAFDIYLPAVGGMVRSLDGDANKLQQSLSTYLIGGAIASLFIGALSDHFGRRAPMLLSIGLLAMASTACALSSTADELIFFRLLQGMASGAGAVLAVATARDQYDNVEAHRIIGRAAVLLILAPVIAPFAGGWLFVWFGWRATFVAVAQQATKRTTFSLTGKVLKNMSCGARARLECRDY